MKKTRWSSFLGGYDLIYTLSVVILLGIVLFLFNQLNFIFEPIVLIVSNILMPFVIALLMYYLFNPIIGFLEKHKVKRLWGVILLYFSVVLFIGLLVALLIPMLQEQLTSFIDNFPTFIDNIITSGSGWIEGLPFGEEVETWIQEGESFINEIPGNIGQYLSEGFTGVSSVISGVTNVVITIATFPIILFFLLKDEKRFFNAVLSIVPPKWRDGLVYVSSEINTQVGAYVKGQLIVATSVGVMLFIGFTIIGLDYSGILAVSAGFLSIIPYIGPTLSFFPALIVALINSPWMVLKLLIVWMVVQFVDGNLVEPNVMGKQLSVHPLTIIVVLLVMGDLLGLFGLIFGVPIYAIIKVIVAYFFRQFKKRYNTYYGDIAGEYEIKSAEQANLSKDKGQRKNSNKKEKKSSS